MSSNLIGEVEVPARDSNGDPIPGGPRPASYEQAVRAYPMPGVPWPADLGAARNTGRTAGERGRTQAIYHRSADQRQVPPGYSGSGQVVVILPAGIRYYKPGAVGTETFEGRVACNPDEAVQIVSITGGTYA